VTVVDAPEVVLVIVRAAAAEIVHAAVASEIVRAVAEIVAVLAADAPAVLADAKLLFVRPHVGKRGQAAAAACPFCC
jgi:hypothetical protein